MQWKKIGKNFGLDSIGSNRAHMEMKGTPLLFGGHFIFNTTVPTTT